MDSKNVLQFQLTEELGAAPRLQVQSTEDYGVGATFRLHNKQWKVVKKVTLFSNQVEVFIYQYEAEGSLLALA